MLQVANDDKAALKVFRPDNPYAALGLAVSHLMTKPAFANLKFGAWSRILVGQINRKHYCFVVDGKNQIQGFMGWAVRSLRTAARISVKRAGFSLRNFLAFSRPWPMRTSP